MVRPIVSLIIGSWLLLASHTLAAGEYNAVIDIGDPLPAFENLPAIDGEQYSSVDFSEDVLVLVTLSNVCPFSSGIEQDLVALVDEFADKPVRIAAVSYNINKADKMPAMKKRAEESGFNFIYMRDESQTLGRQLGTTVTPEFFVFNKDRKLIYTGLLHNSPAMQQGPDEVAYLRGEPKDFYVADAIRASLAGEGDTIAVTETRPYGCSVEYINVD